MATRYWTADQDDYLKLHYHDTDMPIGHIAARLGRSEGSVIGRANRLGLDREGGQHRAKKPSPSVRKAPSKRQAPPPKPKKPVSTVVPSSKRFAAPPLDDSSPSARRAARIRRLLQADDHRPRPPPTLPKLKYLEREEVSQ